MKAASIMEQLLSPAIAEGNLANTAVFDESSTGATGATGDAIAKEREKNRETTSSPNCPETRERENNLSQKEEDEVTIPDLHSTPTNRYPPTLLSPLFYGRGRSLSEVSSLDLTEIAGSPLSPALHSSKTKLRFKKAKKKEQNLPSMTAWNKGKGDHTSDKKKSTSSESSRKNCLSRQKESEVTAFDGGAPTEKGKEPPKPPKGHDKGEGVINEEQREQKSSAVSPSISRELHVQSRPPSQIDKEPANGR